MIEDRLNAFLVPKVARASNAYVEFNIAEKLQGDFEEQATILSSSTGAPWMTRNEARARQNLSAIEGGDELVTPLNVLTGGQASPRDSGSQNERSGPVAVKARGAAVRIKAARNPNHEEKAAEVLRAFFERQRKSVMSELGSKDREWWDGNRWDRELAEDLLALSLTLTVDTAAELLERLGLDEDAYDSDRTIAFLTAVAKSRAGAINSTTRDQVAAILAGDGPEGAESPAHAFEVAKESRAVEAGATLATTFATFATVEVGKQNGAGQKTWLVTSTNPRPEHASMDGESVGIDDRFSNGASWPGDPVLGADGVAGCTCDVEITFG
jgi:hypothetical protein